MFLLTEPCTHDEMSNEVQITSVENNDLSKTCSSKASFTKNEGVIKAESTRRDDICSVMKPGSSSLDNGKERQCTELSSSLSCVAVAYLLEMSCVDLNNDNIISKGKLNRGQV